MTRFDNNIKSRGYSSYDTTYYKELIHKTWIKIIFYPAHANVAARG